MWASVSNAASSGSDGCSLPCDAGATRSFIRFSAVARSCAEMVSGAAPRAPFRGDQAGGVVDPLRHECRPHPPDVGVGGHRCQSASATAWRGRNCFEEVEDALAPTAVRVVGGQLIGGAPGGRVRGRDDLLEQPLQNLRPWTRSRSRTSAAKCLRPLARSSTEISPNWRCPSKCSEWRGSRVRGRLPMAWCLGGHLSVAHSIPSRAVTLHGVEYFQHSVDSFDSALIGWRHDRICRRCGSWGPESPASAPPGICKTAVVQELCDS